MRLNRFTPSAMKKNVAGLHRSDIPLSFQNSLREKLGDQILTKIKPSQNPTLGRLYPFFMGRSMEYINKPETFLGDKWKVQTGMLSGSSFILGDPKGTYQRLSFSAKHQEITLESCDGERVHVAKWDPDQGLRSRIRDF